MSISNHNQRVGSIESTAANAGVTASNFALPPSLREPDPSTHTNSVPRHRSITDLELAMVQVCADFICACLSLPLALLLLSAFSTAGVNSSHHLIRNTTIDCLFPVGVVVALALNGNYRMAQRRLQPSAILEMRDLSFGVGSGCVLALAVSSLLHATFQTTEPYTSQLIMAVIVAIIVISLGRIVLRYLLHALTTTRVLVVGAGDLVERIMMSVRQVPGMTLVGRAVDGDIYDAGAVGHVCDLPLLCKQLDVHRILVAAGDQFSIDSLNTYRQLQDSVHIAMVPQYFELMSWRSRLTDLAGMPFLEVARPHLSRWDRFMKRGFDLCISSLVLIVTSPLLLVVAIGVKLSSPGPVLFRQVRIGRDREPFTVTKFRSMRIGESERAGVENDGGAGDGGRPLHETRGKHAERNRITPFGTFLRKTGIDELPQFLNVFRGDMSVVGPRPFIPQESLVDGWALRRFDVRPGITGLWQVSGRNDLSRNDLVQLDYVYVASWSLWWDLKIMWETPKTMARGTGAY
jgi:exopolysaccharide biosynthesis polyprenyl glycosylphosphotransferase